MQDLAALQADPAALQPEDRGGAGLRRRFGGRRHRRPLSGRYAVLEHLVQEQVVQEQVVQEQVVQEQVVQEQVVQEQVVQEQVVQEQERAVRSAARFARWSDR
ncbi:hypothetical protein GCM10022221_71320 [Actinocorallia aurea]